MVRKTITEKMILRQDKNQQEEQEAQKRLFVVLLEQEEQKRMFVIRTIPKNRKRFHRS